MMPRAEGLMFLRVEVLTDYGDTVMVRGVTPIAHGSRGRMMEMPPMVIVARADLVEDPAPIIKRTKSGGRSSGMAPSLGSPDSRFATRDLAALPEVPPC